MPAMPTVSMFSVLYVKGKMIAAMFLWTGATAADCQALNDVAFKQLVRAPLVTTGQAQASDIKLTCEWHEYHPIKPGYRV